MQARIVGADLWARPYRRIWASTPQIADYTDFADCADSKGIAACSCAIDAPLTLTGLTQIEQKRAYFVVFNPLKNQRYECLMAFPAPYQGDFKRDCVSPNINEHKQYFDDFFLIW